MESEQQRVTLNFHRRFVTRLREYAKLHKMKLNAVLKAGFELLEDQPAKRGEEVDDYYR